ncbi:response regulator [Vallitalea sediminicola]
MYNVLIVDDNLLDIKGMINNIEWETLGLRVCGTALDGLEGYKKSIELKPNIVITDISMPRLNGIEMTRKIKEELPETKFIFISCFDEFEFTKSAMELNINRYVLKPIDVDELQDALIYMIGIYQMELAKKLEKQELEKKINESLPLMIENFYYDLIYGKIRNDDDIINRMNYLNIYRSFKCYNVFYIEIDNYELNYSNISVEERYKLIERVKFCVEETVLKEKQGFVIKNDYRSVIVVLYFDEIKDEKATLDESIIYAINCREYINKVADMNITIGLSGISNELSHINNLLKNAQYAVESKFYSRGNAIIMANEVMERTNECEYDLIEIKNELSHIFEEMDRDKVNGFLQKYYGQVENLSTNHLKSLSYSIINIIQVLLLERNLSFSDFVDDEFIVWKKLSRFETIVDIRQWINNIILGIIELIKERETNRYSKIVEDIIEIIETEYREIDNIRDILDSLYISSSYANQIFKQQKGITIFEYLIQTKIEMAKKRLQDPYCRICDISNELGYKSNAYFTSVFKRHTGITPKEYRKRYSV